MMKNTLPWSRVRGKEILSILLFFLIASAIPVEARDCGGSTACGCGDKVVRDHILTRSLGPCPGAGLRIVAGVILDGNGQSIRGTGNKAGILFEETATGAVVRNLEVSGFKRGIRFSGVHGARLENVQSHHNGDRAAAVGYGVDLAHGASANVLVGLRVYENADEGIHFGTNANRNRLEDSEIFDNYRENVYFLQNRGNEVHRSRLRGGGAAAFYVKHAPETLLQDNEISDRPIQIRGRSDDVRLVENRLSNSSVHVEPFKGEGSRGLRMSGGSIASPRLPCIRLRGARDARVEGVGFSCRDRVSVQDGAEIQVAIASLTGVLCRGTGSVTRLRQLASRFVDPQGRAVEGIAILDGSGGVLGRSDSEGKVERLVPQATMQCPERRILDSRLRAARGEWSAPLLLDRAEDVVVPDATTDSALPNQG